MKQQVNSVYIWTGTNVAALMVYPHYAPSYLQITEIAPDSTQLNPFKFKVESWWYTRPCKYCERQFKEHCEYTKSCGEHKTNSNLVWKTKYEPMDNLTYTEWIAKERSLV